MKLTNVLTKLTGSKAKVLGGLLVMGAALTAAAPAAKAQVAFGVSIGGPRYYAPAPRPVVPAYGYGYVAPAVPAYGYGYAPGYWDHRRYEDWRAHQNWEHRDYGYRGYPGGYWHR